MAAAALGECEVVRLLLSRGANTMERDNRGGTALDIAEEKDQDEAAAILRRQWEFVNAPGRQMMHSRTEQSGEREAADDGVLKS